MEEKYISDRVSELRRKKKVSARDMSLSIGQNENYINHIENRKIMPSITGLFYICDYFKISPTEFFDSGNANPTLINDILRELKQLNEQQLNAILEIVESMNR